MLNLNKKTQKQNNIKFLANTRKFRQNCFLTQYYCSAIVSFYNYDLQTSTLICLDEFEGGAIPGFVSISSDFSITIAADKLFRHECDNRAENEPNKSSFRWRQNLADLTLFVDFEKKLVKSEVEVVIKQSNISVNVREIEIVGELFQQIDPEESSWVISPGGLEITLQKVYFYNYMFFINDAGNSPVKNFTNCFYLTPLKIY